MKQRYRLYRRNGTFYLWDNLTGKRESLETKNADDAKRMLHARNEAQRQPALKCKPWVEAVRACSLCWHLGGSQGDIAALQAEDIDWTGGFERACSRAGVSGVTLHSYRYAWAERAKTAVIRCLRL